MWEGQDSQSPRMAFLGTYLQRVYVWTSTVYMFTAVEATRGTLEIAIMSSSERFENHFLH